jgi:hypothetical protein
MTESRKNDHSLWTFNNNMQQSPLHLLYVKRYPFRSFWLGATFNLSTSKGLPTLTPHPASWKLAQNPEPRTTEPSISCCSLPILSFYRTSFSLLPSCHKKQNHTHSPQQNNAFSSWQYRRPNSLGFCTEKLCICDPKYA